MREHAPTLGPALRDTRPHAHARACARTYKTNRGLDRTPRSLSARPKHKIIGVRSAHGVPAAARAPTSMDRPLRLTSTPSNPSLASLELSEAPRALRPSTKSPEVPD
jgi:hypothetical protein